MKIKAFIFLIIIGQTAFGQSENHIIVTGTKCTMIPPEGFIAATGISGFQNKQLNASIAILEIPVSVQEFSEGFATEGLSAKGMTLVDKAIIGFDSSEALYIKVSQSAKGITYHKQMLVFGDSLKAVLVIGVYPEKNKIIETDIHNALLSTRYNESQNINPLEAVNFMIKVNGTEFKLVNYFTGSLIYTIDGAFPSKRASLVIGNSIVKVPVGDKKQFCIDRLNKLSGGKPKQVKEINPITIDNLTGYEVISNGENKDLKEELIYQTIIFTDKGEFYFIVGTTTEDLDNYLRIFKNISATFKRK